MRAWILIAILSIGFCGGCSALQGSAAAVATLNVQANGLAPMSSGSDNAHAAAYLTTSGATISSSGTSYTAMYLPAVYLQTTVNFFSYVGGRATFYSIPADYVILQRVAHGAAAACSANLTSDQQDVIAERLAADTETLYAMTQGSGPPNLASLKAKIKAHMNSPVKLHKPGVKATATPILTWGQIEAMVPANLLPLAQPFEAVLVSWTQEELAGWVTLLQADSDTAMAALYGAMTPDQLIVQIEADGQALDAAAISNAADIAAQKNLLGDIVKAAGNIIEAALASVLGGLL
jgi:hypothetical protein